MFGREKKRREKRVENEMIFCLIEEKASDKKSEKKEKKYICEMTKTYPQVIIYNDNNFLVCNIIKTYFIIYNI